MKKYDVVALGELLIDFTDNGLSGQGNPVFEANPGGAPCNVLAMLRKLDKNVAFIGKVGCDGFGKQLAQVLKETDICTEGLCWDEYVHTTLAVVHTLPGGDRDFSFYRNPGADMMLTKEDLPLELIRDCRIFQRLPQRRTEVGIKGDERTVFLCCLNCSQSGFPNTFMGHGQGSEMEDAAVSDEPSGRSSLVSIISAPGLR